MYTLKRCGWMLEKALELKEKNSQAGVAQWLSINL